jgi:hypothetical protein
MHLSVPDLKVVSSSTLQPGSFFVPVAYDQIHVVIGGGKEINAKFAVPLGGPNAFKARRIDNQPLSGFVVPHSATLAIAFDDSLKSTLEIYQAGILTVDENGAAFGVNWKVGWEESFSFVNLTTWEFEDYTNRQGAFAGFTNWKLVSQIDPNRPHVLAKVSLAPQQQPA